MISVDLQEGIGTRFQTYLPVTDHPQNGEASGTQSELKKIAGRGFEINKEEAASIGISSFL